MATKSLLPHIEANREQIRNQFKLLFRFSKPFPKLQPGESCEANSYFDYYHPRSLVHNYTKKELKVLSQEELKGHLKYCLLPKFQPDEITRSPISIVINSICRNLQEVLIAWYYNTHIRKFKTKCNNPTCCNYLHLRVKEKRSKK